MLDEYLPRPFSADPERIRVPEDASALTVDPAITIRFQALEIIQKTLRSPDAAGEDGRARLRQRLEWSNAPERSEEVLLEHLQEMVRLNNPGFDMSDGDPREEEHH